MEGCGHKNERENIVGENGCCMYVSRAKMHFNVPQHQINQDPNLRPSSEQPFPSALLAPAVCDP